MPVYRQKSLIVTSEFGALPRAIRRCCSRRQAARALRPVMFSTSLLCTIMRVGILCWGIIEAPKIPQHLTPQLRENPYPCSLSSHPCQLRKCRQLRLQRHRICIRPALAIILHYERTHPAAGAAALSRKPGRAHVPGYAAWPFSRCIYITIKN